MHDQDVVRSVGIFGDLTEKESVEFLQCATRRRLESGAVLVRQGDTSDDIFIVVSGRFCVYVGTNPEPVAEISPGELIGEIGFFARERRTATVTAARDSEVIKLDKAAFDGIAKRIPRLYELILASLAKRLADTTKRVSAGKKNKAPRTIAILWGGRTGTVTHFVDRLRSVFSSRGRTLVLEQGTIAAQFPGQSPDLPIVSDWLNAVENDYDLIVYVADDSLTAWTQKAIRQADQVIIAVTGAAVAALNPVEELAFRTHRLTHRRLVVIHEHRQRAASGTPAWLASRPVYMHHHVAIEDDVDFASFHRFLVGQAIGYVAGGGGGFGPAHVGIFKAFQERGIMFDIMGGTSVGAAMMAGFAFLETPEAIDASTREIFVTSRGLKRKTLPRYSMLDHTSFDASIRRGSYDIHIEDAWRPYYAIATDLSANGIYTFRSGPLWKAIRASGSIPGVLPPMFTDDGRMLVDGGLIDNIPLKTMQSLKTGPNVVVHFGLPAFERFEIDYDLIPGRWPLLRRTLFARHKLPRAPGPVNVLRRCLAAGQNFDATLAEPSDLILGPPPFPGSSFLDFDRHTEVFHAAYHWALGQIDLLIAKADPAMMAILQAGSPAAGTRPHTAREETAESELSRLPALP